jgi:hypothetical protein
VSPLDARTLQLIAELRRDWEQVITHRARAESVNPDTGDPERALVALSLDHAYQAFETFLVRTERALGLPERVGSAWHVALLTDAGAAVAGLRPAVYPAEVAADWEHLLRFRHFLRHAYTVALDPARLRSNRDRLGRAVAATGPLVGDLLAALERD